MPRKPLDLDLHRLCDAIRHDRKVLEPFRVNRREMVRQYVGKHWSDEGTRERVPVNLLALYVQVVARNLIAKNPRVLLSTFRREFKPVVSAMQAWANAEVESMGLANTVQRVVLDGLFSLGVCKVGLATPADSASAGWNLDAGAPFAARVDLDDFVYDTHARDFAEATYVGHRYRVPLDAVKDSKLYGSGRKKLQPSADKMYNEAGDERVSMLGRSYLGPVTEFEDMVDLWEIYLPRHRLVLTLADDYVTGVVDGMEELRRQPWVGPEGGPYHFLRYQAVPGNAMPKGPIQDLWDLHESANRLYRKLIRQAERQKTLGVVDGAVGEDADAIVKADDGDAIGVRNPERFKEVSFGSPNAANYQMADALKNLFGYVAGNLDMMGGLSPQSKTLGQDKLLAENASGGVRDMQETTVTHVAGVVKGLCWYWHHDPFRVMQSTYTVRSSPQFQVPRHVTPDQRGGMRFEDMDVQVDPYSMTHSTPSSRLSAMNGVVTQIVLPMMQLLQQQGVAFDVNAYLGKVGKYLDMPDLAEILTITEPSADAPGPSHDGPRMPQSTERRYVRENMPGRTQQGDDRARVAEMMRVNPGGAPGPQGVAT